MSFPHDIPEHIGMYFSVAWLAGCLGASLSVAVPHSRKYQTKCSRIRSYRAP